MPMCKGIELGDICGDIGDVFCKKVVFFLAKSLKILYLCMYFENINKQPNNGRKETEI